mgnify:CR=1 FL=1
MGEELIKTFQIAVAAALSVLCGAFSVADDGVECPATGPVLHLSVIAGEITNMIEKSGQGPYLRLLREIEAQSNIRFDVTVLSDRRAKRDFSEGMGDVYMIRSNFDKALSPVQVTLDVHGLHAFVRKGEAVPTSLGDLKGKRVGLPYLYSFPKSLTENADINVVKLAESAHANLEALAIGRVDATIVPLAVGEAFLKARPDANLTVDVDHPVLVKEASMVFRPTLTCAAQQVGQVVEDFRRSGKLFTILAENP